MFRIEEIRGKISQSLTEKVNCQKMERSHIVYALEFKFLFYKYIEVLQIMQDTTNLLGLKIKYNLVLL